MHERRARWQKKSCDRHSVASHKVVCQILSVSGHAYDLARTLDE